MIAVIIFGVITAIKTGCVCGVTVITVLSLHLELIRVIMMNRGAAYVIMEKNFFITVVYGKINVSVGEATVNYGISVRNYFNVAYGAFTGINGMLGSISTYNAIVGRIHRATAVLFYKAILSAGAGEDFDGSAASAVFGKVINCNGERVVTAVALANGLAAARTGCYCVVTVAASLTVHLKLVGINVIRVTA